MRAVVLLLVALAGCAPVRDGAAFWNGGDQRAAVERWASVQGTASGAVHYNLGVAAYRAGELPLAIAHWRAARRLAPRDGDVVHNLAHVRGDLSGTSSPVGEPLAWMEFATPVEVGLLGGVLLGWASFGLVARRRRRSGPLAGWLMLGGAGCVVGAAAVQGVWAASHAPIFVMTADGVLRDAPDASGQELGSLVAGSELSVRDAVGPWVRVSDGGSRRGWLPADAGLVVGPVPMGRGRVVSVADVAVPEDGVADPNP